MADGKDQGGASGRGGRASSPDGWDESIETIEIDDAVTDHGEPPAAPPKARPTNRPPPVPVRGKPTAATTVNMGTQKSSSLSAPAPGVDSKRKPSTRPPPPPSKTRPASVPPPAPPTPPAATKGPAVPLPPPTPPPARTQTPPMPVGPTRPAAPAAEAPPLRKVTASTPRRPVTPPAPFKPGKARGIPRPAPVERQTLQVELQRRADRARSKDAMLAARALVELGMYEERTERDRRAARKAYDAARALAKGLQPAATRSRRMLDGKAELPLALEILVDEIGAADDPALRADLLAERARACEALGKWADARKAYTEALAGAPRHAASLRGLEALLRVELARTEKAVATGLSAAGAKAPRADAASPAGVLAAHLEQMAVAFEPSEGDTGDSRLAAWFEVERADVLDHALGQPERARAALERALSLDPRSGPIRGALERHLVQHRATAALVEALVADAEQESDDARGSRLLYTAARLLISALDEPARALPVLRQAAQRAPKKTPTRERVLIELVAQLEAAGDLATAAAARTERLAELREPERAAHEHLALADAFAGLGRPDDAAAHATAALELDPDDAGALERLDRALELAGRNQQRVLVWVNQGNSKKPTHARVTAFTRAAEIASQRLRRTDEAIVHLRAAWVLDPGNGEVFDALSSMLAPAARDPEADVRGARTRIELYMQAVAAGRSPARKVAMLEKAAHVWEDELALPDRALEVLDRVLELEHNRQSAILAMQRCARRAGDGRRLSRALAAEAALTTDKAQQRKLLLRAADVTSERVGDRDHALALIDQALASDPGDVEALRARWRVLSRAGRHEDARKALSSLIARDPQNAYPLWIELARLDERELKRPADAVKSWQEAARLRSSHPLARAEIARLLRQMGEWGKLCDALHVLAEEAIDPEVQALIRFELAEIQELKLHDDAAALETLKKCEARPVPEGADPATSWDPAVLEAMERILIRRGAAQDLAALYGRWLGRVSSGPIAERLRIALANVVFDTDRKRAVEVLDALVEEMPGHVPALRMLERLHRATGAHNALSDVVRAEAVVLTSPLARCFANWEIPRHEEHLGGDAVLAAHARIVTDAPGDSAALDAMIRTAGKLWGAENAPADLPRRLLAALRGRRELAREPIARATYQLEEAMLAELTAGEDAAGVRAALGSYRAALSAWPESLLAARGLERVGTRLGDGASVIVALLTASTLADNPVERADNLVRAAELTATAGTQGTEPRVLALYEDALGADPDNAAAASALVRLLEGDSARLAERLGPALERARVSDQIVLLGMAIGRAALRPSAAGAGPTPAVGIDAMRAVLAETPDNPHALRVIIDLFVEQKLWREAESVLAHLASVARDDREKAAVQLELATLYEKDLADPAAAEARLEVVLSIDPKHKAALERLHRLVKARGDEAHALTVLGRLVEVETDPGARIAWELELAHSMAASGDRAGAVRALCEAAVTVPNDSRAWNELAAMHPTTTPDGALAYAKALQQLLDVAAARKVAPQPQWLTTLGLLEIRALRKTTDGVARLEKAAKTAGASPEARLGLGRGLETAGRTAEAIKVLRDVLSTEAELFAKSADTGPALLALETALGKERRNSEAAAVTEVRACLGEVGRGMLQSMRSRPLGADSPYAGVYAGGELARLLVDDAKSPLVDVAVALSPVAAKALSFDLSNLRVGSRERVGPRDGNPTRHLADRIAKSLGLEGFELYVSPAWEGAVRVYPGDPPILVTGPAFLELPEGEQAFSLGRLLTRAALGFTWLDELSIEAADALLMATIRTVEPGFGSGDLTPAREQLTRELSPYVQKAVGRRQKKSLERVVPTLVPDYDARAFTIAIRRTEYRAAYVLSGNLVCGIDYLSRFDRQLARSKDDPRVLLDHPVTNELLRYALSAEAFAERKAVGTVLSS